MIGSESFQLPCSVLQDCEGYVLHSDETTENKRLKRQTCMQRKMTLVAFVLDLGLMCDTLEELCELCPDM
jgi:hypothetical protein